LIAADPCKTFGPRPEEETSVKTNADVDFSSSNINNIIKIFMNEIAHSVLMLSAYLKEGGKVC